MIFIVKPQPPVLFEIVPGWNTAHYWLSRYNNRENTA